MESEGNINCLSVESDRPSEKCFTIIWEIENPRYFNNLMNKLYSPVVVVDVMERTGWRLVLYRLPPYNRIYVTVKRETEDEGPEQFDLYYDFEVTPVQEEEEELENKARSHAFRKDESGPPILLRKNKLYLNLEDSYKLFRPHNITIKCRMKKNNGPIPMSGQCVARTRIGGEYFNFVSKLENFKTSYIKRTLAVLSSSTDERLMTVDLRSEGRNFDPFFIDIIPMSEKPEYKYIFSSTYLDCSGNEAASRVCCQYSLEKAQKILLGLHNQYLLDYEECFLPNNTLSVLCEIAIQTGTKSEEIEKIEYEVPSSEAANQKTSELAETSPYSFDHDSKLLGRSKNTSSVASKWNDNLRNPFPNALEDITSFYKKGILCDAKLQTATETFPVHKAILSARSSVFEAMFTSNMKEKIEECVRIDDVEAETVKRMLLFLYSDSLEELEWSDAKKLYFAADKYQVLSLKYWCSEILKRGINLSNCCELLLLADMHQDKDLKAAVQNYIARYDKEVFLSNQWRDLEMNHPLLAISILRVVHIK